MAESAEAGMSPETRETLERAQQLLAKDIPEIMEFDLDDPDTPLVLLIASAMLKGETIEISSTDEDGRTENLSISGLGKTSVGEQLSVVAITSSDGMLSAETADLAAELMAESHAAEIDRLIAE